MLFAAAKLNQKLTESPKSNCDFVYPGTSMAILYQPLVICEFKLCCRKKCYSREFRLKLEWHRKLISENGKNTEYLQAYVIPLPECRDKSHNTSEITALHAWVKNKLCIENHYTFNQKETNLLQEQFQTRTLHQNRYKSPICYYFCSF